MNTYRTKNKNIFSDKKAQEYGERLERISKNGELTPDNVLDDAESPNSPLHSFFQWNDIKAAQNYRRKQARKLITNIELIIEVADGKSVAYNSYLSFEATNDVKRKYHFITKVLSDEELRETYLAQALKDAETWQMRYKQYKELKNIFDAISKTKKKIK